MEGYNLARQVENIVLGPVKKGFAASNGVSSSRHLFPIFKVQQGMKSSALAEGQWVVTQDKGFLPSLCLKHSWRIERRRAFVFCTT